MDWGRIKDWIRRVNEWGEKWRGIVIILTGIIAVVTILGWIWPLKIENKKLIKEVKAIDDKNKNLAETFNEKYLKTQRGEYSTSKGISAPFNVKPDTTVSRGTLIIINGIVKYPFSCKHYWILFLEGDRVWPKISIENLGTQGQEIEGTVAVPLGFDKGKIVLSCVPGEIDKQFSNWLGEGRDTPLQKPSQFEVVLESNITIQ